VSINGQFLASSTQSMNYARTLRAGQPALSGRGAGRMVGFSYPEGCCSPIKRLRSKVPSFSLLLVCETGRSLTMNREEDTLAQTQTTGGENEMLLQKMQHTHAKNLLRGKGGSRGNIFPRDGRQSRMPVVRYVDHRTGATSTD
jgi:hypothetical protein